MFNFLWDMHQQKRLAELKGDMVRSENKASDRAILLEQRLEHQETTIERLLLINRALWEIIQENHSYDNGYLINKITDIDLRDGKLDGKLAKKTIHKCNSCGMNISKRHLRCILCGSSDLDRDVFDL